MIHVQDIMCPENQLTHHSITTSATMTLHFHPLHDIWSCCLERHNLKLVSWVKVQKRIQCPDSIINHHVAIVVSPHYCCVPAVVLTQLLQVIKAAREGWMGVVTAHSRRGRRDWSRPKNTAGREEIAPKANLAKLGGSKVKPSPLSRGSFKFRVIIKRSRGAADRSGEKLQGVFGPDMDCCRSESG